MASYDGYLTVTNEHREFATAFVKEMKNTLPDGGTAFDGKPVTDDLMFDFAALAWELYLISKKVLNSSRVGKTYNLVINLSAFLIDTATNATSTVVLDDYIKEGNSTNAEKGKDFALFLNGSIDSIIKNDSNLSALFSGALAIGIGIIIGGVLSAITANSLLIAGVSIVSFLTSTYLANTLTLEKLGLLGGNDAKYVYGAEDNSVSLVSAASFATLLKNHWDPDEDNNGIKYYFERTSSVEDPNKDFFQVVSGSPTPFVMKIKNGKFYFQTMTLDELKSSSNHELEEVLKYVPKEQEVVFYTKDNLEDEQ